jgi:hypothetical protein
MYTPLSKIKTNLYTNGEEYILKNSPYVGFYYKLYNGQAFTGKNPNDSPTEELTPIITKFSPENSNFKTNKIITFDYISVVNEDLLNKTNSELILNYNKLKNITEQNYQPNNIPVIYYPSPTPSDYQLSEFTRYFCKKTNQNIYIEISLDYYTKLTNQDPTSLFTLYFPFKMQWKISGDKEQVFLTNKNMTKYTENQFKLPGLGVYLKDYLKFYK